MFERLGSILGTLITLDEIIAGNSLLHDHWGSYRRMVRSAISSSQNQERKNYESLERLLNDLEITVMQANTFKVQYMSVLKMYL